MSHLYTLSTLRDYLGGSDVVSMDTRDAIFGGSIEDDVNQDLAVMIGGIDWDAFDDDIDSDVDGVDEVDIPQVDLDIDGGVENEVRTDTKDPVDASIDEYIVRQSQSRSTSPTPSAPSTSTLDVIVTPVNNYIVTPVNDYIVTPVNDYIVTPVKDNVVDPFIDLITSRPSTPHDSSVEASAKVSVEANVKPSDAKPSDAKAPDVEANVKPLDAKSLSNKPLDAKPLDAKPSDDKPSDDKPKTPPSTPSIKKSDSLGEFIVSTSVTVEAPADNLVVETAPTPSTP